jgi:thiamine-phosphate pyrophosphorylase
VVAGDAGLARAVGADGVHLAAADPWPDLPAGGPRLAVGRSCHTAGELAAAAAAGAAWATYSPVYATDSKPGYGPAIGAPGLQGICTAVAPVPVWALGGVTADNAAAWVTAGAHGIFVMGGIMAAADPAAAAAAYVDAISSAA